MFNASMPYYDRDGYYTYEQVKEAFGYVEISDPTDDKYHQHFFYDHLKDILKQMKQYKMEIILAREVLKYDNFTRAMVGDYRIVPIPFKSINKRCYDYKVSAPNYRRAKFCGNCIHFRDETDYDDMLNGICELHTQLHMEYDPVLKVPMDLGCHDVCDDFKFDGGE